MFKKYLFPALLLLNLYTAFVYSQNPVVDVFMKHLEGMDLEETRETITIFRKRFEEDALLKDHHKDLKRYTKEEEKILDELPENLDRTEVEADYDTYFSKLVFTQFFYPDKTVIQITDKHYEVYVPDHPKYLLKKIWYRDGSTDMPNTSFYTTMDAPQKVIDSIQVVASYQYLSGYETYKVKDRIDIEDGNIEVKQMKDNKIVVAITGRTSGANNMIALNEQGEPLVNITLHRDVYGKDFYNIIPLYAKAVEKVEKKAGKIKSVEKLKENFRKALASLPSLWSDDEDDDDEDGENSIIIYTVYCEGNVGSALVSFIPEEGRNRREREFILRNNWTTPIAIPKFDEQTGNYGLINPSGEEVVPPGYPEFFQINNFYYGMGEELTYVYATSDYSLHYLDKNKRELVELPDIEDYYRISENCIAIKKGGAFALWNEEGTPVTGYIYDEMSPMFDNVPLARVRLGDYEGIIDYSGETVFPLTAEKIGYFHENPVVVVQDKDRGYLLVDKEGNVAVSLSEYSDVGGVSKGMAVVKKDGKYGFVDALTGELVIPLIYDDVYEAFSKEGIAAVMYEGLWGLIDTTGKYIVEPTSPELDAIESAFYKWRYKLNGMPYDAYGRALEKEE